MTKIILMVLFLVSASIQVCHAEENFLSKPTGQYGVGFEDFHWINMSICPDPNGKNPEDFSADNKNLCHETVARVYYPTAAQSEPGALYYSALVKGAQADLSQDPNITKEQIAELATIHSFAHEKAPILSGKNFPVILFSPGLGCQIELYENFITELVSHGYIVVGINSPFVSGDIELPNGHIVKYNADIAEENLLTVPTQDFAFVYEQLHTLHAANPIFSAMDLHHVGAFGHSIGGDIVANAAHEHVNWFAAAATLDIGIDPTGESLKKFSIPFLHAISAVRISASPIPVKFELGNQGYLVGIAPDEKNDHYSFHMNFTDDSTLQYVPAFQTFLADLKEQGVPPLLGSGNGLDITRALRVNLVEFFNTFLLGEKNPGFGSCKALAQDTYMKCGPTVVPPQS